MTSSCCYSNSRYIDVDVDELRCTRCRICRMICMQQVETLEMEDGYCFDSRWVL
jgi:ferredoxin